MPGWDPLHTMVDTELTQCAEEGRDLSAISELRQEFDAAGEDETKLRDIWKRSLEVPMRADFAFEEPSDLESIRALRPAGSHHLELKLSDEELFDQMYGAWLGRCVGCALGKPVEGFMNPKNGLNSPQRIKEFLLAVSPSEYPLNFYFPKNSPAEDKVGKTMCPLSTREQIAFMESDDDIRYTVLGQMIMNERGRDFTTFDVARTWITQLPYNMVCTAETQAYKNLVERYDWHMALWFGDETKFADAIDWNWVANHENPYREWIGAQIRADSFGYAAPGNPGLAADFAWRDARMTHIKNGIYGEMFCAAMIAAAFALDNPRAVVEAGLNEIPQTSRLYAEMQQVVALCDKHDNAWHNFERVLEELHALLGHYHPVHTNNNAGLVVVSLLLCEGDFEKAITLSVMGGWDTDCNGATVGSIWGAAHGAKALPEKWTAPLHDTLNSQIIGYHPIAISECARRSIEIAQRILQN